MKKRVFGFGSVVTAFVVLGIGGPLRAALDSPIIEPPEVMRSYAEQGDPTAQFNLALLAAKAEKPNMEEAVAWYRKAAAQGFPPAQFNLGILLGRGEGVAKDEKEAVKWFYEAGRQGLFEAQKALIECYSKGLGVEKNPATALTWDFLARRSLELRYEQSAGEPPKPPKLRADGFAEFTKTDGTVEAVGPDGTIETTGSDGRKVRKRPDGSTTTVSNSGLTETTFKDGRTVTQSADGQKQTRLANGMVLTEFPDGRKEYQAPDGGSLIEYPDGRKVETDRNGTIERKFPDGTREVEGGATLTSGKPVRAITKYDKAGQRVSQKIIDGIETIEQLPDGSTNVETIGHDEQGREVRVINNYTREGHRGQRKLIRVADGVERAGEEFWVIKRWVNTPDGKMALMKEKYGLGNSTYDEEILETKDRPRVPSTPPPVIARSGTPFGVPAATPSRPMPPTSFPADRTGEVVPMTPPVLPNSMVVRGFGSPDPSVYRQKVPITAQLDDLAKLEQSARNFAGATEQDYEKARATAKGYVFTLTQSPQKPQSGNWLNQRIVLNAAPPPPPPLRELPEDRSKDHPLGLYGRTLIKENRWKHAETEHFVVHYMQAADAYPVMRFIECAYFFVTQTLMIDDSKSKRKSHVFVFPDTATWASFTASKGMSPAVAGFAYKDELLLGAHDEKDTYLKVLCHEATHAIVARFYAGRKWPLWLNEGFADYMAAKTLSLRRGHKMERYLSTKAGRVEVNPVFNRIRYGDTTTAAGTSEVVAFYGQSEKCVRTLLEKLPPGGFPKFANLVFAGNALPICLREAYLDACPDLTKFETLVNATP